MSKAAKVLRKMSKDDREKRLAEVKLQLMKDRAQLLSQIPKHRLPASFGDEHNMVLAIPFGMGHALE